MSDSSQRRGTDLNSLRSAGAGTGRLPREAEDPLAELARLVSQGEPSRPRVADMPPVYAPPRAPEARVEPRADYTPPPVEPRVPDRLDPLGGDGFRAEPRGESHSRSYGAATAQPDYDPDDDFFADNPPPLRGSQGQGYNTYQDDEFETTYDAAFQARQPYGEEDFDDSVTSVYPADDDLSEDDAPVRRRGGMLTMGALMSVGLVAGFGAWAYFSLGGGGGADGAPPVIEARTDTPMKVVAEAKPIEKSKKDYDRIPVNADSSIGPGPEEPGEKPRVIIPNQLASAGSDDRAPASTSSQDSASNDAVGSVPTSESGMRVVKTIPISAASLSGSSEPAQGAAASELPPPIQGSGVAEGMSLQPGKDYSIVNTQPEEPVPAAPPAATASSQPSQMAFASEQVPLPQPRPLLPQVSAAPQAPAAAVAPPARAATPVQPPTASGGPPSSPQPQVTVTNKRALQPQGAPPPARSSQRTTAPAAPRQIAMAGASPPPVAAAPAPAAAAPAPVQSAPQVAAVSSSSGAFGVQLTAQRSQEEALAAFNALKQRHPQVLGPYTATVARADLGDRGVFYRALVPAQSQADASNLCIQFKSAGVDCIVQRR